MVNTTRYRLFRQSGCKIRCKSTRKIPGRYAWDATGVTIVMATSGGRSKPGIIATTWPGGMAVNKSYCWTTSGLLTTLSFIAFKPLLDASGYPPLFAFLLAILLIDLLVMWVIMRYEGWKQNGRVRLDQVVRYREKAPWRMSALVFIGAFVLAFLLISFVSPATDFLTTSLFSWLPGWMFLESSQPFGFFNVFLLGTLLGIVFWWQRDIRLSIGLHITANMIARLSALLLVLAM